MLCTQQENVFDVALHEGEANVRRFVARSVKPPTHTTMRRQPSERNDALFQLACSSCAAGSAIVLRNMLRQHAGMDLTFGNSLFTVVLCNQLIDNSNTHTHRREHVSLCVCVGDLLQAVINLRTA